MDKRMRIAAEEFLKEANKLFHEISDLEHVWKNMQDCEGSLYYSYTSGGSNFIANKDSELHSVVMGWIKSELQEKSRQYASMRITIEKLPIQQ